MWFNTRSWSRVTQEIPDGPIRQYVVDDKPDPATPLTQARLLAVDVETTGMDPKKDQILSIGFVPVNGTQIDLSGAGQVLVRAGVEVGDSARIHGITDDAIADALTPSEALDVVFGALRGRVMICHHAAMETGFIGNACNAVHGFRPRLSVVDTLALQFRLLSQGFDEEPPQGSLRLWTARSQFGLPRYAAHNALTDALACAELYLAQTAEFQAATTKPLTLKSVLKY